METYWRSGGVAPATVNLGARWRGVVSFTPRPLYSRRKPTGTHWIGRLFGLQNRSVHGGEGKVSRHCPCRELNPGRPARSLVIKQTLYAL
jgi:hypothetical protein